MSFFRVINIICISFFLSFTHADEHDRDKRQLADPLFNVTVPEAEIVGQFHGDPFNADLRLYMAGNQFVVMDLLVEEFKKQNTDIKNIFYVTIPPGKELQWILKGGIEINAENSLAKNGFQLRVLPDVFTSVNKGHMDTLAAAGFIEEYVTYAHNRLVLMVKSDDPLANTTLDPVSFFNLMTASDTTISEPDIITQGIERHIWQMYTDTSKLLFPNDTVVQSLNGKMFDPNQLINDPANSMRRIVYHDKELTGTTLLTSIHHLETPFNIRAGNTRLGPVWVTEVEYQKNRLGETDLAFVEIGGVGNDGKFLDRREKVNYVAAKVKARGDGLPNNKEAAKKWVEFLLSETAQKILEGVGFIRATPSELTSVFEYPSKDHDEHHD